MITDPSGERTGTDRASLRLSATLLLTGQLLYIVVTQFHTGGDANDHREIFVDYAASDAWVGVHVAQFLAMAVIMAGFVALYFALDARDGGAALAARLGVVWAAVALALYAVLQAVDGVGNKQVDQAWVQATPAEKAVNFASADAMRWLEWGARSYHDYALGIALLLFAAAATVMRAVVVPRTVAYLMGVSGITYLAQGWVVGSEGFSETHTVLILLAWLVSLAWMIWLVVAAWRVRNLQAAAARLAG